MLAEENPALEAVAWECSAWDYSRAASAGATQVCDHISVVDAARGSAEPKRCAAAMRGRPSRPPASAPRDVPATPAAGGGAHLAAAAGAGAAAAAASTSTQGALSQGALSLGREYNHAFGERESAALVAAVCEAKAAADAAADEAKAAGEDTLGVRRARERAITGVFERVMSSHEADRAGWYVEFQHLLPRVAPTGHEKLEQLVDPESNFVVRDPSSFLVELGVMSGSARVVFIRGRRWGKSVLGSMWLAFLRGDRHLLLGLDIEKSAPILVPPQPRTKHAQVRHIGIHLDLSLIGEIGGFVLSLFDAIETGLHHAATFCAGITPLPALTYSRRELIKLPQGECETLVHLMLADLCKIARLATAHIAFFVDEYDRSAVAELKTDKDLKTRSTRFLAKVNIMMSFFVALKTHVEISHVLIVGSSRLPFADFWSGGNDIKDRTFDPTLATALGFTWSEIRLLFEPQLRMLAIRHQLSAEGVRSRLERLCNHHRWCVESVQTVFNQFTVCNVMASGKFSTFWNSTGKSTLIGNARLLSAPLLLAAACRNRVEIELKKLSSPVLQGGFLDEDGQIAVLVAAGVLSVALDVPANQVDTVSLVVPNDDVAEAALEIARTAWIIPPRMLVTTVDKHVDVGHLIAAVLHVVVTGALRSVLALFQLSPQPDDPRSESEFRVSMSFSVALLARGVLTVKYLPEEKTPSVAFASLVKQVADALVEPRPETVDLAKRVPTSAAKGKLVPGGSARGAGERQEPSEGDQERQAHVARANDQVVAAMPPQGAAGAAAAAATAAASAASEREAGDNQEESRKGRPWQCDHIFLTRSAAHMLEFKVMPEHVPEDLYDGAADTSVKRESVLRKLGSALAQCI